MMQWTARKIKFSRSIAKSLCILFFLLCIIAVSRKTFELFVNHTSSTIRPIHPRGVIVALIRSTNRSILLAINMIHSVIQFHASHNASYQYPFIIFHDQNFTSSMREYILSCVLRKNKQIQISFVLLSFQTNVKPNNGSHKGKAMGYRLMCRFWAYDVFYHPAIIQGHYDYLMRMDDDSYFSDVIKKDLFQYMDNEKLDYIYRALYHESITPMKPIVQRFLNKTSTVSACIYNNFFIMRLQWFYRSKPVQTFLRELLRNDLMLREYIGDGCVHAAMLGVDNQVKLRRVTDVPYGHNYHTMPANSANYFFNYVKTFDREVLNSCHQLTVIPNNKNKLKKIKI